MDGSAVVSSDFGHTEAQSAAPGIHEIERQIRWEHHAVERGIRKYRELVAAQAVGDTGPGLRVIREIVPPLVELIKAAQAEAQKGIQDGGRGRPQEWWWLISFLSPEALAVITLKAIFSEPGMDASTDRRMTGVARSIGTIVWEQMQFEKWAEDETRQTKDARAEGKDRPNLFKALTASVKDVDRRTWSRWQTRINAVRDEPWPVEGKVQLGAKLLTMAVEASGGWFELVIVRFRGKQEKRIRLSAVAVSALEDMHLQAELGRPSLLPMICPPKPWTYAPLMAEVTHRSRSISAYEGGYYLIRESLIRAGAHDHTANVARPISDATLTAINAIQATAWSVNNWILDLMRECWVNGDLIGGLPSPYDQPLPTRMDDGRWSELTDEAKRDWKRKMAKVHGDNARAVSSRASFVAKLVSAEELRDRPAIYFPHFADFRGRVYPLTADLSPQSDDVGKSLIQFAEGKAVGGRGMYWLAIRLANTFGLDKLSLGERRQWAWDNTDKVCECARSPLDGSRWWTEAEEPWQFLATCREWEMMTAMGDRAPEFISHLPVNLDGTANGLQHLSAIGLDRVGARATNMTDDPVRHDIYNEVASVAQRIVSNDAVAGNMEAHKWVGRINRSVVKRAVMTTPYGVTDRGIRDQLLNDGFADHLELGDQGMAADYLRDVIVQSLGATVSSAKMIMAYIQAVALAVTEAGYPLQWKTPTGNTIQQTYSNMRSKTVRTLVGKIILLEEDRELGLNARKNAMAAAPNVIHSLDASHLVLTVNELVSKGVTAFSMIHDSYGVHAADAQMMSDVLREQFISMYVGDWLADFEAYVQQAAPGVELPDRPDRGTFNILEVRRAGYFFA